MSKLSNYISHSNGNANTLGGHSVDYFASQGTTYTKVEIDSKISNLIDGAPELLDTLNEISAAIDDDANFATTISNRIDTKLDSSTYTANDILTKIKTVDGSGSGLDADLLDGYNSDYFLSTTGKAADSDKLDGHDSTYFMEVGGDIDGGSY